MHIAFVVGGLPGPAYHGGAVTCWAIIKTAINQGHKLTIVSLFDNSSSNPYLASKEQQIKILHDIGAGVEIMDFESKNLKRDKSFAEKICARFYPKLEDIFSFANLQNEGETRLKKINPDVIFCYHFDVLSAVYKTKSAPIMAGVGDLWHLPSYFRLQLQKKTIKKIIVYKIFERASIKYMVEMLKPCAKKGAFAAHYAEWLKKQKGLESTLYLRTPAHDPVGDKWLELRNSYKEKRESKKCKILMIGDIGTTSTSSGIKEFLNKTIPILEKQIGATGFEIHMVGGGTPSADIAYDLNKSYIKIRGRISPADGEFLSSDALLVPTPITLGIRVRIISAFSFGCPVVAHKANAAGIPELSHENNSLLADSGEGLGKELVRLLKDSDLKRKLEENGRLTYEKYFSERVAAMQIVRELENMSK
jgi:glycosyltransferase involved in cell wall biosynthesis